MQPIDHNDEQLFENCLVRATIACRRIHGAVTALQEIAPPRTTAQVQAWTLLQANLQSFTNLLTLIALDCRGDEKASNTLDAQYRTFPGNVNS
jgi:hypothetical protein